MFSKFSGCVLYCESTAFTHNSTSLADESTGISALNKLQLQLRGCLDSSDLRLSAACHVLPPSLDTSTLTIFLPPPL